MNLKLVTAPAPHIHASISTKKIMVNVLIALAPAAVLSIFMWGWYMLALEIGSMVFAELLEYFVMRVIRKKKDFKSDGSAAVTALLLVFNVPAGITWWMMIAGLFIALVVGKEIYGGIGNNPFNPALVGRLFMYISFPVAMTSWPKVEWFNFTRAAFNIQTSATPLGNIKLHGVAATMHLYPHMQMGAFLGSIPGSAGEMSVVALVAGFLYLWWKKIVTFEIPVAFIGTTFILSALFWFSDPSAYADPVTAIMLGGIMLGALYMATDPVTSPVTAKGKWIFGIGCGVMTVLIRYVGVYPEGVNFAILLMNALVPFINQITKPKVFGVVKKNA